MDVKMKRKYKQKRQNTRAQVTIFIIIALIIVVSVALIFVLFRKPTLEISPEYDPQAYVEKCTKDAVDEALTILMPQGSYISPSNYKLHKNEKIGYLCYNKNYYYTCINQEPMLIEHIEKEITEYIQPKVKNCFNSLKQELENRGYSIEAGEMNVSTELKTRRVVVEIDKQFDIIKGETRKFSKFRIQLIHPIYDLAEIALEIVNQEAEYCTFAYLGFMIFYPQYDIDKFVTSDDIKIYTITERASQKTFKFAIRSCALPPAF